MFELSKVFLYFLIQHTAVVAFSLARSKALATFTGAGGYGLIAQATSLVLAFQVILSAGLGSGFVKLIAENASEQAAQARNRIASGMYLLGSITGLVGIVLTGLFSRSISEWVFNTPDYANYVLICVFTAFFVFQTLFFQNLFRGLLEWKTYTLVSILGTGASLFITVTLIGFFHIDGGIWALLISQAASFLVAVSFFRFKIFPRHTVDFWNFLPTHKDFRLLLGHIGPLVITQVLLTLSNLVTRSLVIQQLGLEDNGIIQVSTGISDAYMGLILAILFSFILPKIASTLSAQPQAARQTQNDGLRFSLLIITPFLVTLLATREIWIPLLYSRAFLAAQGILVWQFLGDFFLVVRRCMNIDLVPAQRLKYLVLDSSLYAGGMILLAALLLPQLGVYTVVVASLIVNLLLTGLSLIYHHRRMLFRPDRASWTMLFKSGGLLGAGLTAALAIPHLAWRVAAMGLILLLMVVFLPQRGELEKAWREIIPGLLRQSRLVFHKSTASKKADQPMD